MDGKVKGRPREDEAVSPVIGVILMVGITVILTAVIATVVLGMTSTVEAKRMVAANAIQNEDDILIYFHGGPDRGQVQSLDITVYSSLGTASHTVNNPVVGCIDTFPGLGTDGKEHVIVIAHFNSNIDEDQVILDAYV
ncbi:MAG: type IV pilin N-terminal domain-containing protein [Methanomicrobiales archaeon]|nr:type IV pilin N-terminal domain-containing protein [Methanomicrobiales archaeon]